jgi:hypothetical protein
LTKPGQGGWLPRTRAFSVRSDNLAIREAEQKGFTGQKTGTHLTHDVKDYAGEYTHPGYGTVSIALDDKSSGPDFKLTLNRLNSPLRHFRYDIFEVPANPLDPFEKSKVAFHMDLNGDISSLTIVFSSK